MSRSHAEHPNRRPAGARPPQSLQQSVANNLRNLRFPAFPTARPAVMVVSHERSGTHFLMNAIARGYGYAVTPWMDLDYHRLPINYHLPELLAETLAHLADKRIASVIKSHHAVEFFDNILDKVLERTTIFYIHRDPVAVMRSFHQFINHWRWREGPKCPDAVSFARAEPEGQMLRYQMKQRPTMLHRWAAHVEGWTAAAAARPRLRVVRYDQLKDNYAATLTGLADLFDIPPRDLTPPPRDVNVIAKTAAVGGEARNGSDDGLRDLALSEVGDTMRALGYA